MTQNNKSINVQTIVDLMLNGKNVDPWDLTAAAEGLYRSVKIVGIQNTRVHYTSNSGNRISHVGNDIPIVIRCIAAYVVTIMNRWNDSFSGRIEKYFGLPAPLHLILSEYKFNKKQFFTVKEMVDEICTEKK